MLIIGPPLTAPSQDAIIGLQEGFHPQQIVSEEMLHQKVNYLHHNPVRIGVVEQPEDWVYSSAGDYAGGKGLIELDV